MTDPHVPLREDVRLLGDLLGATLRDHEGETLFATVERVRTLSKRARSRARHADPATGDAASGDIAQQRREDLAELRGILGGLPVDDAVTVARAFAHFLALANVAEQHHRVRRRRDHLRNPDSPPQRGSLEDAFVSLMESGIDAPTLRAAVLNLAIEPVLTAHPTEAMRRTLLQKYTRVADALAARDRADLTPRERRDLVLALRREVTATWLTDEVRHERPTPLDEARWGYAVIEGVLWDALPVFLRDLDTALRRATGDGLPLAAAPIRIGSWMGGDRDGNPRVTPKVTRDAVWAARWVAADLFVKDVRALRRELSMTEATDALRARVGDAREPHRTFLKEVRERLIRTRDHAARALTGDPAPVPADAYASTDELRADIALVHESLHATGAGIVADGALLDTMRRVECFGLALVRVDLRQDAERHADALDAITQHLGLGSYVEWSEEERQAFLIRELEGTRPLIPFRDLARDDEVMDVIDTFRTAAALPRESLGAYVISMAKRPSDVLAVELLQRECGMAMPQRVVPLFETLDDLDRAGETMRALFAIPWYREHIRRTHGDRQEVMIGYSDSAKDAGILAASWALYRGQEDVTAAAKGAGVTLTLFHGRGGSPGRGGGPAHAAIRAQPPGSVAGSLRITEQGEVIQAKFGLPGIALRTLERYVSATVSATLSPPAAPPKEWRDVMDRAAAASRDAYRGIVRGDPRFVPYFRQATPEQELGHLNIGSRPARRGGGTGGVETLRAIPWVFAWTQNRLILPAWLGVGDGLRAVLDSGDAAMLKKMASEWAFLRVTLDQVDMVLAKAEPDIATLYDEGLVDEELRTLGDELREQYRGTVAVVLETTGNKVLLEANPVLRRSIGVRNPYVDPLNVVQVELLARARRGESDALRDALVVTINGIASGMRNTG